MLLEDGKIPSAKESYDLVTSFFVLEHVANPLRYFFEAHRVLKPGGRLFLATCNHLLGYEHHYSMWLPLFSKRLSRLVLKTRGKNLSFFDDLRFITPRYVDNHLKMMKNHFSVHNVGKRSFREELDNPELHSPRFISLAKVAQRLGLIPVLERVGLYNPLIYILTKRLR